MSEKVLWLKETSHTQFGRASNRGRGFEVDVFEWTSGPSRIKLSAVQVNRCRVSGSGSTKSGQFRICFKFYSCGSCFVTLLFVTIDTIKI